MTRRSRRCPTCARSCSHVAAATCCQPAGATWATPRPTTSAAPSSRTSASPDRRGCVESLQIGSDFAGYRVEALIGGGGMGRVYRAVKLDHTQRTVALKVIAPQYADDEDFRDRFVREARTASLLDHPNVIGI